MTLQDLIESSEPKIQSIAGKMARTYRLSREDQEDLCSAMRMHLFQHYEKIDFSRPEAPAYAHHMITNAARTYLMRSILKHKRNVLSLDETPSFQDGSEGETFASMIPDPHSLSEDTMLSRTLCEETLATLKPHHRKMVEMHMAGITNQEIAARVHHKNGKPFTPDYVAYLLTAFRQKLRRRLPPKQIKRRPRRQTASTRFTGIRQKIIRHFISTGNKSATHAEVAAALNLNNDYVKSNINLLPLAGILEVVSHTTGGGPRRNVYRLKDGWQERLSKKIRLALENSEQSAA